MATDPDQEPTLVEDPPPFFRSWSGVYAAVLGFLGFLVLLFELFTRHYR